MCYFPQGDSEDWESGSFSSTASHGSVRDYSSRGSATVTELADESPPSLRRRRHSPLSHCHRDTADRDTAAETCRSWRQLRRRQRLLQLATRQTSRGSARRRAGSAERPAAVMVLPSGLSSSESELDALRRAVPVETDDSASRAASRRTSRSLSFQCLRELEHMQWNSSSRGGRATGERGGGGRRTRPETLPGLGRLRHEEALVHHSSPHSPTSVKSVSFGRSRHLLEATVPPPTIYVQPPSRRMSIEVAPVAYSGRRSAGREGGATWRPPGGAAGDRAPSPMRAMNLLRVLSKSISPVNGGSGSRQRGEPGRVESSRHRSRRRRQESYV